MSSNVSWLCRVIHERTGIVLGEDKVYLIESRLHELIESSGEDSLDDFLAQKRSQPWGESHREMADLLTTNETYFFRDIAPFDALKYKLIPDIIAKRTPEKKLRIWCGAASTGQEPYSVNMILQDNFPRLRDWNVSILATDLSERVIKRCREGIYSQQEIDRGLPPMLVARHFDKENDKFRIKDPLRENIEFKVMNLLDSWFNLGTFDDRRLFQLWRAKHGCPLPLLSA